MNITLSVNVGHMLPVISSLVDAGWKPVTVPMRGNLPRNRLLVSMQTRNVERNFRLHVFKVTESSRNRDWERRIEITTTYQGNLKKEPGFLDVVLGFDVDNDIFVGVDPIRLHYGGPTTNASSFLEIDGLKWKHKYQIGIWSRPTELRSEKIEYQAYFKPPCFADYLMNLDNIHKGIYSGSFNYGKRRYNKKDRYQN